ncbi:MAG: hypothetical protein ACE365_04055 [Gammaproteobacteria bacterium]
MLSRNVKMIGKCLERSNWEALSVGACLFFFTAGLSVGGGYGLEYWATYFERTLKHWRHSHCSSLLDDDHVGNLDFCLTSDEDVDDFVMDDAMSGAVGDYWSCSDFFNITSVNEEGRSFNCEVLCDDYCSGPNPWIIAGTVLALLGALAGTALISALLWVGCRELTCAVDREDIERRPLLLRNTDQECDNYDEEKGRSFGIN